MGNSRNKSKYVGTEEVYKPSTGEYQKSVIYKKTVQDLNFVKIFIPTKGQRMYPKEMIISARDVFEYLMVVSDKQNIAIAPTSEMVERLGLAGSSISRGRSQLLSLDFIRMRSQSIFMLNPAIACKVDGDKRQELLDVYLSYKRYEGKEDKDESIS